MVIVASNEPKEIHQEAREIFGNVVIDYLYAGDIVCPQKSIVIERKEILDFAGSVLDKRVYKQAEKMRMNYKHCHIIIVGNYEDLYTNPYIKFGENRFMGAICDLVASKGINVLWVQNRRQFWKATKGIFMKTGQDIDISKVFATKKVNGNNVDLSIVCQVPGVGPKMGNEILKHYDLYELFDVSEKDLRQIKGVGKTYAKSIKKVFKKR